MAEAAVPYALTTKERVKDKLAITSANFDLVFNRLINSATDYIERECNRRFLETTYVNEVHSLYGEKQRHIYLKQAPVSALTSFQFAAGIPNNKMWTDFLPSQYELVEDGASGIIRVYGYLLGGYFYTSTNLIRATYTAGYKISFADAGDTTKHNLPADLTELAERLVIRYFKRREVAGKEREFGDGGNVIWRKELEDDEIAILNHYRRLPEFY